MQLVGYSMPAEMHIGSFPEVVTNLRNRTISDYYLLLVGNKIYGLKSMVLMGVIVEAGEQDF